MSERKIKYAMTTPELIDLANKLGIKYYNACSQYICLEGVNGHATVAYSNNKANKVCADYSTFAHHLKQMGRDSLKMDLERLLNITTHA